MEIEAGEYIRTEKGFIIKLNENNIVNIFNLDNYVYIDLEKTGEYFEEDKILKHSKNIYDLIEHEDIVILEYYVQKYGKRIQRKFDVIKYDDEGLYFENAFNNFIYKKAEKGFINGKWYNPKIKLILTHEQYEQNSYKIGE